MALGLLAGCGRTHAPPPAPLPASPPAATPPASGVFTPRPGFVITEGADQEGPKLSYGAGGGTDDVELMMGCDLATRTVKVMDLWNDGPGVTLKSMEISAELQGQIVDAADGSDWTQVELPTVSPVLAAFRQTGKLTLVSGAKTLNLTASPTEKAAVARFLDACDKGKAPSP